MQKVKVIFRIILITLNVIIALGLIAGVVAPYVSPEKNAWLPFFGLLFPFFLLADLFFLVFWLIARWKRSFISGVALLLSVPGLIHYFAFHIGQHTLPPGKEPITLLSYNVRNFDLYNWHHNRETRALMMKLIADEKPAIANFQEYYTATDKAFQNTEMVQQATGLKYVHMRASYVFKQKHFWGLATFSKFPVVDTGSIRFNHKTQNGCIWTDLRIDSTHVIRVFNVHLQSIKLAEKEYAFMDSVSENKSADLNEGKNIMGKMKYAWEERAEQVEEIAEAIAQSPYPVLLSGDFNDAPLSYSYHTLSRHLQDAFLQNSIGIGSTYVFFLPLFRIDYILYDDHFSSAGFHVVRQPYSDHYPVISRLWMN